MVSEQEYLATMYEPDCEYVDGGILERNWGELEHGTLQGLLACRLHSRPFFALRLFRLKTA